MILSEAYSRITFKIGTPDDSSARAKNPQASNTVILNELLDQLRSYANITKGIRDVYSFSLSQNISFVAAPTLALRSRGYLFGYIIVNGGIFPMDFRGERDVFPNFRINPVNGITNWIMPWSAGHSQYLSGFPNNSSNAKTTTLTTTINSTDTTLVVGSTSGLVHNFGRVTIDSEKILYEYIDATHLYGCTRGVEQTTAASHTSTATITENNIILMYCRLPEVFAAESDGTISAGTLAHVLEPCDEHMEGIIKATVYNLLLKIDVDRADRYKVDTMTLYTIYENDIESGYSKNRQNINIRDPWQTEQGVPYSTNLY